MTAIAFISSSRPAGAGTTGAGAASCVIKHGEKGRRRRWRRSVVGILLIPTLFVLF